LNRCRAFVRKPLNATSYPTKPTVFDHLDRLRERLPTIGKGADNADAIEESRQRNGGRRCCLDAWLEFQDDLVEDLFIEVLGAQEYQSAERGGRGIEEPHRRARPLIPVLPGDTPCPIGFTAERQVTQAAAVAKGGVGGVNLLRCPDLVLGGSVVGDLGPL